METKGEKQFIDLFSSAEFYLNLMSLREKEKEK